MMSRISNYVRGFSVLLSDVAMCCLIVGLIPLLAKWELYAALPVWIGYLAALFLADDLMASFGVPMNVYLLGNGAVIGAGTFLTFRYSWCSSGSMEMRMLLACCAAGTGVHGAAAAYRLPGSNGILRYVDCMIAALAFYLYAVFQTGFPGNQEFIPLTLAAMGLDLLMVNHLRTGDESRSVIRGAGAGGKLVLALMFSGCLIVTGAVVGLASGQVHSFVDVLLVVLSWGWNLVEVVFGVIGRVLGAIILLLVMILPATPKAAKDNMMASVQESAEEIVEYTGIVVPGWMFGAVLGAGALVLAGWIMYRLRHTTFQRKTVRRKRRRVVRRSYLFPALMMTVKRIRERLAFEWTYRRFRKTPQGLFVLAERVGKQRKVGRRASESPGEYMRRLDGVLRAQQESSRAAGDGQAEVDEESSLNVEADEGSSLHAGVGECSSPNAGVGECSSLARLADILDRIYYAGQSCELTAGEYQNYADQIFTIR